MRRWRGSLAALGVALAAVTLSPAPASAAEMITVRVVPPLPGVRFELDGQPFVSNERGIARIESPGTGTFTLRTFPYRGTDRLRARFARWWDDTFRPTRQIELPGTTKLEVGFDVYHPIRVSFQDLEGRPVDPARVESVMIRSSLGEEVVFTDTAPQWIRANRILRRAEGLEAKLLLYSVMSAEVDGSNVVNRAEHRFTILGAATWDINLLLYSATFTAKDAIFGTPIGSHVMLEYPDGSIHRFRFGPDGRVTVPALARGDYLAWTQAPGYSPPMPISLSRPAQLGELKVVSFLDLGLFGLLFVGLAVGLVLVGRPHLARQVASAVREASQAAPGAWQRWEGGELLSPRRIGRYTYRRRARIWHRGRESEDAE